MLCKYCVQLGWSRTFIRGNTIIMWVYKGARCHQCKEMHWWVASELLFCLQQVKNYKFFSTNGQATCHNFDKLKAGKCHMGWRLGCRIFYGQFNQDVIWETNPWHVWPKSKGTKNYSTHCTHIDGALYNWIALEKCYWR